MTRFRRVLFAVLSSILLAGCFPKQPAERAAPVEVPEVPSPEWTEDTLRDGHEVTVDELEISATALPHQPTDGVFTFVRFRFANLGSMPVDVTMVGLEIEVRPLDSSRSGPGVIVERQPTAIFFAEAAGGWQWSRGRTDGQRIETMDDWWCYLEHGGGWPVAVTVPPTVNVPRSWAWEMVVRVADVPLPGPDEVMVRRGIFEVGGRRVEVAAILRPPGRAEGSYNYVQDVRPFDCNGPFTGDTAFQWPHLAGVPIERLETPPVDGPRAWTRRTLGRGHGVDVDGLRVVAGIAPHYPTDGIFTYVKFYFHNMGPVPVDVVMVGLEIEVRPRDLAQFGPGQVVPRFPNDIFFLPNPNYQGGQGRMPLTPDNWCDLGHRGRWPLTFTVPPGPVPWEMHLVIGGIPVPGPDDVMVRRGIFDINGERVEVAAIMRPPTQDQMPSGLEEMRPFDCNGPIPDDIFGWERPHLVDNQAGRH